MFRTIALTVFLFAASIGGAANAEEPTSHQAAALELLRVSGAGDAMTEGLTGTKDMVVQSVMQEGGTFTQANQYWTFFVEEFEKLKPQMLGDMAELYVQQFTENEINELIVFYKTPIGKKLVSTQGFIIAKSQEIGMAYGQRAGVAAGQRLNAE